MRFANADLATQAAASGPEDIRQSRLFSRLFSIVTEADEYAQATWNRALIVTSIWRPWKQGQSRMHELWRAIDTAPVERAAWNDEATHRLATWVNSRWTYNDRAERAIVVALFAPHTSATGPHIHFQIHQNTRRN